MTEEWYREANNRADAEALTHTNVEKSLGVVKQEQLELSEKLKSTDQASFNAEASLKIAER